MQRRAGKPIELGILDELVGFALRRAWLEVKEDFLADLSPITPQRFAALVLVGANPGLSQSELGDKLQIARSGSMVLVDWLEGEGLIEQRPRPDDRRSHELRLTPAGEAALAQWKRRVRTHDRRVTSALDDEERAELHRLLRKMLLRQRAE